jgi:hypothetical protein
MEIRDKRNFKYNMTLYSIKKYGANEKILAGLLTLRELFGHSSEVTTQYTSLICRK